VQHELKAEVTGSVALGIVAWRCDRRLAENARELSDLRRDLDQLRRIVDGRLADAVTEVECALAFITAHGLRDDYEITSVARRRAKGERKRVRPTS
jgi:hypothetical protein